MKILAIEKIEDHYHEITTLEDGRVKIYDIFKVEGEVTKHCCSVANLETTPFKEGETIFIESRYLSKATVYVNKEYHVELSEDQDNDSIIQVFKPEIVNDIPMTIEEFNNIPEDDNEHHELEFKFEKNNSIELTTEHDLARLKEFLDSHSVPYSDIEILDALTFMIRLCRDNEGYSSYNEAYKRAILEYCKVYEVEYLETFNSNN